MNDSTADVAETLFENRSEHSTYRVTLDDDRMFEVTCDDFEYDPAEGYGEGYLRFTIEFPDAPDLNLEPDRYATEMGEVSVVEMDDGWGTPILSAAVQYVEDGELVQWEYPTLGTIATVEEVTE
ncbi:hypothetical protein C471_09290 [Halorubrum saccharovorum DSM 1137]|uniref:Uncharacterized protein n=1 Tax=Halorubrum saccharovorum DSM 1137 TaxID=1227484 RepID=M0DVA0_9EURY|nr:hypothetical protein [Halorubrum saccharovorum]ELZ38753.1 hypothetical protein C471_09290 [Halorubrum saccharovorum DSM 1137]